jgi:hypothetical protein
MAVKTGKSHATSSIQFDSLCAAAFEPIAAVGAGIANTVVQARLPLPFRCKIRRVVAVASAIGTGGAHTVQIVVGTGAPGAVGPQDNVAAGGASVFATPLALVTADLPAGATPSEPDVIYPSIGLLTLRVVTPAGTGSLTNLRVTLAIVPVDGFPGDNNVNTF